jgi:hypothetical protein
VPCRTPVRRMSVVMRVGEERVRARSWRRAGCRLWRCAGRRLRECARRRLRRRAAGHLRRYGARILGTNEKGREPFLAMASSARMDVETPEADDVCYGCAKPFVNGRVLRIVAGLHSRLEDTLACSVIQVVIHDAISSTRIGTSTSTLAPEVTLRIATPQSRQISDFLRTLLSSAVRAL